MQGIFSCVLIAGSSLTGKTTLAKQISQALGWGLLLTDMIARHPGRPWHEIPHPVAEYYARLSAETIYWFLRVHHENMRSNILQKIDDARNSRTSMVFEGAALRPEYVATKMSAEAIGICLYSDETFLRSRIESASQYLSRDLNQRMLIDKFIERSLSDNFEIYSSAKANGLICVDASDTGAVEQLRKNLVHSLGQ